MMEISIYQINMDRDLNRVAYMNLEKTEKFQSDPNVDSAIYDKVYSGTVDGNNLEDVYRIFNLEHPEGYAGRSLSVSDVVQIVSPEEKAGFYFCDSFGFQKIDFDAAKAQEQKAANKIRVVMLEPGKLSRVADIDSSLSGLQKAVGGYIEYGFQFPDEACLIVNEEGKLMGLPLNRALRYDGEIIDIIAGSCFICGAGGENFESLTEAQQEKYLQMFRRPERFVRVNDDIKAIPYIPQRNCQER